MITYLEFCGIYSLLFFLSFLGFYNFSVEETRLISDKTKIDNCLFPRGQVFPLVIRLTRLTIPWSAEFIQRISLFSLPSLRGIILEFGLLTYPKLCSWFFTEQRQLLMRLHHLRNKWKHIMCPHLVMNERQLFMRLYTLMNDRQLTYFP